MFNVIQFSHLLRERMGTCELRMRYLVHGLIWPAAAGNVAWAVLKVAIDKDCSDEHVLPRLAVLLLIAIYLACNYVRTMTISLRSGKCCYWIADAFHVASIVVFAIAVQLDKTWVECSLLIVFLVTFVGHLSGVWEPRGENESLNMSCWLAGIQWLGALVLFGSYLLFREPFPWNIALTVLVVLVLWIFGRWLLPVSKSGRKGGWA